MNYRFSQQMWSKAYQTELEEDVNKPAARNDVL